MKPRTMLAILLAGCSIILLGWSVLPISPSTIGIPVSLDETMAKGLPGKVEITWQEQMRLGEPARVSLRLPAVEASNLPATAQAEARLELSGVDITPGFDLRQTVTPGREVNFTWQVWGAQPGELSGRVWLFWTVTVNGSEERLPVLARQLALQVVAFLGLPVWVARLIAVAGLLGAAGAAWLRPARGKKKSRKH